MLYAEDINGNKVLASKGERALCPGCGTAVFARCGEIYCHHWAHKSNDCDKWYEGEGQWHISWKTLFPKHQVEVKIIKGDSWHRADIITPLGTVVELQHSPISTRDISIRENFYGDMIWLFDFRGRQLDFIRCGTDNENRVLFHWLKPRPTLFYVKKPMLFDFGKKYLLKADKLSWSGSSCGYFVDRNEFVNSCKVANS